jgi:thiol-disulfide isomerase/thioredoxin
MSSYPFSVTLYGRPGCHLCDQVEQRIRRVGEQYPLVLRVVNIESDPRLLEKYLLTIPAVEIDGEEVFLSVTSVVTEEELRAELARRSRR